MRAWVMKAVTFFTHALRAQPSSAASERCERTPLGVAHLVRVRVEARVGVRVRVRVWGVANPR